MERAPSHRQGRRASLSDVETSMATYLRNRADGIMIASAFGLIAAIVLGIL